MIEVRVAVMRDDFVDSDSSLMTRFTQSIMFA